MDDDYDTEIKVDSVNFDILIETVRKREQHVERSAEHRCRNNKRNRRLYLMMVIPMMKSRS